MTKMIRKVRCTVCDYKQEDRVSYYLHAKAWKANHDLDKCREIKKSKNAFDKMFSESLNALDKLTIVK